MSVSRSAKSDRPQLHPGAALAAWLLPGLGHWLIGQRVRSIRIMIGMAVLILGGLLIGGFDAVDSKQDRAWFLAQIGVGPIVIAVDIVNQRVIQTQSPEVSRSWRSLGHVNSVGTLSIGLAGLLNVVVLLDALRPRHPANRGRRKGDADA